MPPSSDPATRDPNLAGEPAGRIGAASTITASPSGRLTLPRHARERLGLETDQNYVLEETEGGILIRAVHAEPKTHEA